MEDDWVDSDAPWLTRRASLLMLSVCVLLTGCASRRQARWRVIAPAAKPLELDPSGREVVVARAAMLLNTPYRYGGDTPSAGFDCSGLVFYVFSLVAGRGVKLPRTTEQWATVSIPVSDTELQRGDLVFFNTTGARFSHMGIYVGQGQFVHAPSTGGYIRKDSLYSSYFASRYQGGRRVFALDRRQTGGASDK